jgi:lipopolysaccharide export LptBFGC system permease protein LptF
MLSILHRYVLWDLVKSFVLSFGALIGIMLVGAILKPLSSGIRIDELVRFIPYFVPHLCAWVAPAALLSACVMTYGRLSADNELKAICACGIPLRHMCYPALLLALVLTTLAIPLNDWLIPRTLRVKDQEMRKIFSKDPFRLLGRASEVTTKVGRYKIFFDSVRDNRLENVIVIEPREDDPKRDLTAPNGRDREGSPTRKDGRHHPQEGNSEISISYRAESATYEIGRDGRISITLCQVRAYEVKGKKPAGTWGEMRAKEFLKELSVTSEAYDNFEKRSHLTTRQLLLNAQELRPKALHRELARTLTEVSAREALAFSTLALCFVGVPLGIWIRRQSRLASFAVAVLVFLLLYAMIAGGEGLASEGKLPPRVALWTPDILMGLLGLGMLLRAFRR